MNAELGRGPDDVVSAVRRRLPLVHCLTNTVTVGRVADALAAFGALPVMASAPEEAADMVEHAQALVLNLGTPDESRWRAAEGAAQRARERGIPIVLDPVGCGATAWRTERGRQLAHLARVNVVRGNSPEIAALAGSSTPRTTLRGVTAQARSDGSGDEAAAEEERVALAAATALGTTAVVTGPVDVLSDGRRILRHTSGSPVLAQVVGAGDVLSALVGACLAVEDDGIAAAWAALALFAASARSAEAASEGPGSFWPALIDRLASVAITGVAELPRGLLGSA